MHLEKKYLFPLVSGTDVNRYRTLPERQYLLFPYEIINDSAFLVNFKQLEKVGFTRYYPHNSPDRL